MTTKHAKLGASTAHRWMVCPGSIRLTKDAPEMSSIFAQEGTAAHELAATCLQSSTPAVDYLDTNISVQGTDFPATEEMIEAVQTYLDVVSGDAIENDELYVEHKFNLDHVHPGMFGTSDAVRLQPFSRLLRVYDFKYGRGIAVDVVDNPQLLYYGVGSALQFKGFDSVELVIVQPRAPHAAGPVRRWRLSILDLLDFIGSLRESALKTEYPDSALHAGEHCIFCPARGFCPELRAAAQAGAMAEFSATGVNLPAAPNFLTPDEIDSFLRHADLVEIWIAAVREYAHATLVGGGTIPNWKLVAKRANRVWGDEMDAAMTLMRFGIPETKIYVRKIVSPAVAEKLLPKADRTALAEYIRQGVSSGTTLAKDEDPRPGINRAENEFTPVQLNKETGK